MASKLSNEVRSAQEVKGAYALALMGENKLFEANQILIELCKKSKFNSIYWLNLSATYKGMKRINSAFICAKTSYILNPNKDLSRHSLIQSYSELGKNEQARKLIEIDLRIIQSVQQNHMFNLQFLGEGYELIESQKLKHLALEWENKKVGEGIQNIWKDAVYEKSRNRRIKIAYLSSDLCNHPVARFIAPIIKEHDKKRFEIICVNGGHIEDEMTEELKLNCDKWLDIKELGDFESARLIAEEQIDIIIELGGYTANSRLGVLCYKPAPIQLSYLGYFAPTYLNCIDGWIGDDEVFHKMRHKDLVKHEKITIKGGYMAYKDYNMAEIKSVKREKFRYGTFNHSRKLSDESIKLFSKILKNNPSAEFFIKSISFVEGEEQKRIKNKFKHLGIAESRVITMPWVDGKKNHLELYTEIDVALDPFPYGGATTTCESLIMGVPVITLRGTSMVNNLSASILKYSNCSEWIANDKHEYLRKLKKN